MQNELLQFLLEAGFALLGSIIFFLFGKILLYFLPLNLSSNKSSWFNNYCSFVLGIVVLVTVYSIIVAKFATINILFLPVLILLFFYKRGERTKKKIVLTDIPWLFLVAFSFLFVLLFHLFPESGYKQEDALFYTQISHSLNITGAENVFGMASFYGKPFIGTGQYHYFEFWINSVLLRFFAGPLPGVFVMRFVCHAILCSATMMGLFALAENISKKSISVWQQILCLGFVFYWPNLLAFFHFLRPILIFPFESNMLERPNLRTLYLFVPGLLIALQQKKIIHLALFWLVATMVSSALYFLVFFFASGSFFLWETRKFSGRKAAISMLVAVLLITLLYFLFYRFTQNGLYTNAKPISVQNITQYLLRYWKIFLFSTITSIIYCLLVPVVFIAIVKKLNPQFLPRFFEQYFDVFIYSCLIVLFGIAFARMFNFVDDAYQLAFVSYSFTTIFLFVFLIGFVETRSDKNYFSAVLTICLISIFLVQRYLLPQERYENPFKQNGAYLYHGTKFSAPYLQKISSCFPKNSDIQGAYWADKSYYDSVPYYSNRNPKVYTLPTGYVLAGKVEYNYEVCLSAEKDIMYGIDSSQKVQFDYLRSCIDASPYFQYKFNGTENEKRLSFIKSHHLQYLLLSRNADTTVVSQLKVSKYFADSATGEKFYLLKDYLLFGNNPK